MLERSNINERVRHMMLLSKKNKYKKTQQTSDFFLLDCDFSDIVQKII